MPGNSDFFPFFCLLLVDAFGECLTRLEALLGQAVPAGACLQIPEQIWVEVGLGYGSDAVFALNPVQADLQDSARGLQKRVGFCIGDGNSVPRAPLQKAVDEVGEAFGAALETRRGPQHRVRARGWSSCCCSHLSIPRFKARQGLQPRGVCRPQELKHGTHELFDRGIIHLREKERAAQVQLRGHAPEGPHV